MINSFSNICSILYFSIWFHSYQMINILSFFNWAITKINSKIMKLKLYNIIGDV